MIAAWTTQGNLLGVIDLWLAATLGLVDHCHFILESLLKTLETLETLFARFLKLSPFQNEVAVATHVQVLDGWIVKLAYGANISNL